MTSPGPLRSQFTDEEIREAYDKAEGKIPAMAKLLSSSSGTAISPQLARYWAHNLPPVEVGGTDASYDIELARAKMREYNARTSATSDRRIAKALADLANRGETLLEATAKTVDALSNREVYVGELPQSSASKGPMTVELLLSDLQIGKLAQDYNSQCARRRLATYTNAVLAELVAKTKQGWQVERIVLALIGDIIESDKKHKNSARATDCGTAEQIHLAQLYLYELVIEPLAATGIQMEVLCVTGNHDHDDHGINMFEPGKNHLSYGLYNSLALISKKARLTNVEFDIPVGTFTTTNIYGQAVLYEHGVGVAVSEAAMRAHKGKRSEQLQKHLTYFRMGDKHTVTSFNAGQFVVNGAFFGTDNRGAEYSGILGFCSVPAQWCGFHVPRRDSRFTLYDSFTIQLDHIK